MIQCFFIQFGSTLMPQKCVKAQEFFVKTILYARFVLSDSPLHFLCLLPLTSFLLYTPSYSRLSNCLAVLGEGYLINEFPMRCYLFNIVLNSKVFAS